MASIISKSTLFDPKMVNKVISLVKGKSALAALSGAEPIAFNGNKEFTFTLDNEVDIVAENGAKSNGGATLTPVTIVPLKVEYGVRISDEFLYASEEEQVEMLTPLFDGMAKKIARGVDIMPMHGVNPRTKQASEIIGQNHFDAKVQNVVTLTYDPDADVEAAIALVEGGDHEVTGMAMAPSFKSALAGLKDENGRRIYPDLAWGKTTGAINGLKVETNNTVSFNNGEDRAIVGDFENMYKWGYAKEMFYKIIEYGNPDNDAELGDLQGHNQIYVRAEAYVGWGILDPNAFAIVKDAASLG